MGTQGPRRETSLVPALGDIRAQSRRCDRCLRLPGRRNDAVPDSVRVSNFGTRLATDSALQRHGASHRRMDFAGSFGTASLKISVIDL